MGRQQIRCHGDEKRFLAVAEYISHRFGNGVKYIADVAGGRGLLSRILNKKYNYESEVIDPRGFVLNGVPAKQCIYTADMAEYYDLVVGLHPDGATRAVADSAIFRPILLIPCCNEWDRGLKLGTAELTGAISEYLNAKGIHNDIVSLDFRGPKNIGIVAGYTTRDRLHFY